MFTKFKSGGMVGEHYIIFISLKGEIIVLLMLMCIVIKMRKVYVKYKMFLDIHLKGAKISFSYEKVQAICNLSEISKNHVTTKKRRFLIYPS